VRAAALVRVAHTLLAASLLAVLGAGLGRAQGSGTIPFDFNLTITVNNSSGQPSTETVNTNNDTVNFTAPGSFTVTATYTGSTSATLSAPTVQGSVSIAAAWSNATPPIMLTPGQFATFKVTCCTPTTSSANAEISVPYTETIAGNTIKNSIIIIASATSPNFSLAYAFSNNVFQPVACGGTITFAPTALNTTATATLDIINSGSGPGYITNFTVPSSTSPFQLENVPPATTAVPYQVLAGAVQAIGIQYTPTAVENDTGQVTINFQSAPSPCTINLAGSGATSTYTYEVVSGTTTTPVTPGGTITLPAVPVPTSATATPSNSSVVVQVKNTGNASGVINSIAATPDPPFGVTGLLATPPTLKPGDSENFSVTFTPTQTEVGVQKGTLLVGNDMFTLMGTGQGSQLSFAYSSAGSAPVSVGQGGVVVFPNTQVSQSSTVNFTVTNTGTTPTTVTSVGTSAPFSLGNFSPTTLNGGLSMTFLITFTPTVAGPQGQTLVVNGISVTLQGVGTAPPALPSYTLSGPSGTVGAASQSTISLTLNNPYPAEVDGVLTLTTSGALGTDQSVQFTSGGRTVDFVIPANGTSANFAGQGPQIQLQTGTVAETVTLTPSFATASGIPLTPANPPTLQFTIAPSAPVLEIASITGTSGSQTAASFTLVISGYTTTRELDTLTVTLTPASGFNLASSQVSVPLSGASSLWFQSTASQAFGGAFVVNETFNLTGTAPKNETLLQAIASISATISNSVGTSSAVQTNIQ